MAALRHRADSTRPHANMSKPTPSAWPLARPVALTLPLLFAARAGAQGTPLGFEETFALAPDRTKALDQLIAGSPEYYFYACLAAQHAGDLAKADELLAAWRQRHGRSDSQQERIEARQSLLKYRQDPASTYESIVRRYGLRFDQAAVVPGATPDLPTALAPAIVSPESWLASALPKNGRSLDGLEDRMLERITARELNDAQVKDLLSRLRRPDVPGLVGLVSRELGFERSGGFGSLQIHGLLLLSQLDELLGLRPELLADGRFVDVYLRRLAPHADEDPRDLEVRGAHLARLERFALRLAPAFDHLEAHVGYHRLVLDLEQGRLDAERLLGYLRVARQGSYSDPAFLRDKPAVELGASWSTGLDAVGDDEPVVREYLGKLFATASSFDRFVGTLRRDYVQRIFAEAKILAGDPDAERWYSLLNDAAYFERLKDRVELEFPRGQRREYAPDEPVRIELDVKNVSTLLVKVFEIDTLGFYEGSAKGGRMREIDAAIDLDGLVAHEEQTYQYDDAPVRRVRRSFDFPRLSKAGVYVVEFIGNGMSSRAVIRKGALSTTERVGAAGHVFQVLDHAGQVVQGAAIRFGGREYTADARGAITIPYTTDPGRRQLVLRHGDFGVLDEFTHRGETYALEAGIHADREALLAGEKATLVIRPRLTIAGERVRLDLLEDVTLEVVATDLDGVTTSSVVRSFAVSDQREALHEILVPPRTTGIGVTLRGTVKSQSAASDVALATSTAYFPINGIDATDEVESPLLSRTAGGFVLEVRGKNGEAKAARPVSFDFKHRDFRSTRGATLQTDASGRIELGALEGIERIQVAGVGGEPVTWHLAPSLRSGAPSEIHVTAGSVVRVPYEGAATKLERQHVSLLELRSGAPAFDRFGDVKLSQGYVEVAGLGAGDYRLTLGETGQAFDVRVTAAARAGARTHGGPRRLELSRPIDLAIVDAGVRGEELVVRLAGATPRARVHVTATRYVPAFDPHAQLALGAWSGLAVETVVEPGCAYESGRRISDEYRYILDRRFAKKFPGNMLARAGLLLNPWAIDESTEDVLGGAGAEGGRFRGGETAKRGARVGAPATAAIPPVGRANGFANLDFLGAPAALALNLAPDADGVVRVPLAALGGHAHVRVVAVDDDVTLSRTVTRAETPLAGKDRRLALTLDPAKHLVEERRIELVDAGGRVEFSDAANAGVETYDSLDDVFRYYTTQGGDPELAKFEFLVRWPSLSNDEKLAKYSEFACHELHVFLREKDPDFFQGVVAPYLANKAEKTFLDRWLLGGDLARYFEPWAFAELNTFERILLLRGANGDAARHVRELVELLPPDTFALRAYFDTVMSSSALDTTRPELNESLRELERRAVDSARYALGGLAAGESAPPASAAPGRPAAPTGGAGDGAAARDDFFLGKDKKADMDELKNLAESEEQVAEEDLARRQESRGFFRALPDTEELAERNYWRVLIANHDASLVTPTPFWVDFAASRPGQPFLSPRFPLATRNLNEMLLALAVLDLPFEAAAHKTEVVGQGVVFQAGSRLLMARKGLVDVKAADDASPILIGQDFFRLDEPFSFENGRQRDKLVTGEFVKGVPYGCRVVVTNPTSTPVDVELLLQIPAGALPVRSGFTTKGLAVSLGGYGSTSLEYAFYFPTAGSFRHYPAHVGADGALLAFAPAVTLGVVDAPTTIDTTSWEHVSQVADVETLFRYLDSANLARLDLSRLAWRMKDRAVYERVLGFLRGRFGYDDTLWSFGIRHKDERAAREYLERRSDLVGLCGPWFESPLLTVEPVSRRMTQHLEYEPLVNGRVHRFGPERRILNASFARQYQAFLAVLATKPRLEADDRIALVYYLLLQERVEEALAAFEAIDSSALESRLQYDYMRAYLAFYTADVAAARKVAEAYIDHPVQRWRARFRDVIAQLDEAAGKGAATVTDPESRDQQQGALAATEPSLELSVEARRVMLTYANVAQAEVRYRPMDIELLFSTNPFLASGGSSFGSIKPNRVDVVPLPKGQDTLAFDLPAEFQGTNVLVEVRAGGVVRSQAYYANDLRVQGLENYGQVAVRRATDGAPLPTAYVKVYARLSNGTVRFHKDGYTDLRGRFDYVSLSGLDGAPIERYAVLVMSEQHGAVVREFAPPQQ